MDLFLIRDVGKVYGIDPKKKKKVRFMDGCIYQRHVVYVCFPWSTCTTRGYTFFPAYCLADLFLFYNVTRRLVRYKRVPPSLEQQGKSPKGRGPKPKAFFLTEPEKDS